MPGPASARWRVFEGEVFAALAASGFGSAYVATAIALHAFGPVQVAAWRGFVATLALWGYVAVRTLRSRGGERAASSGATPVPLPATSVPLRPRLLRLALLAVLGGPLFFAGMNLSISHVGPTIASFVAGLYAILTALFAPFLLRERLTPRVIVAFVVALVGTALLAELNVSGDGLLGLAWGLTAAISYALYLVLSRRWSRANRLDGLLIAACMTSATALALGVPILVTNPASLFPASVAPDVLGAMGWLAFVAAAGTVLILASVRLIPAARTASFLLLNPVTATVLSVVLLGSRPTPVQIVGGMLVLAGMAAATLPTANGPGPAADPLGRTAG